MASTNAAAAAAAAATNHYETSNILQVLESNRLDLSRVQNLSQCLRQAVGKQRPAPVVKRLLQQEHSKITIDELQAAHVQLLQADFWQAATATTGLYMQRISIVVWFVQYILESTNKGDKNAAPAVNKIVVALLNQMARAISSLVKGRNESDNASDKADEEEDDEEDETLDASKFDPPTIALFAIGVLLRGIQFYVATRPILLSPLWKGICDLAGPLSRMSAELAEETLKALLAYLQEGKMQVSNTGTLPIQQQEFHIKLLVFLVARLTTLLPLYIRSQPKNTSNLLQDVFWTLCELRGVGIMASTAGDSRYQSLQGKIDQCVLNAVCGRTLESRALEALLHTSRGDLSQTTSSRSLGKAMLLRWVLRHSTLSQEKLQARDAELILSICEDLLFVTLPLCREWASQTLSSLLSEFLDLLVASLSQIASSDDGTSASSSSASRQSTLEQLLIRWLSPPSKKQQTLHPLTRELVVSVVCMYLTVLCPNDASRSDSPRSVDQVESSDQPGGSSNGSAPYMLVMMVKMVFDPRTTCEHRRNLASVLFRVTNPPSADQKQLGKIAAHVVGTEFVKRWKEDCKTQRRKRKRTKESNVAPQGGFSAFGVDDLAVLMELLLSVGQLEESKLDGHLTAFCRDLAQDNYTAFDPKTTKGLVVCQQSPASLSLLLSALGGVAGVSPAEFQKRVDQKPTKMSNALIIWVSERWKGLVDSKRSKNRLGRGHSIVTVASLGFLQRMFESIDSSLSDDMLNLLQTTLSRCIKQALKVRENSSGDSEQQQHAHMVLFALIDLLPGIARVISSSCPRPTLEGIAATFKRLFSSGSWPIVARTMTSLVEFASHLPSAHKFVLPLCVTAETQGLLQSRLQNKVNRPAGDTSATFPANNDPLLQLIPSRLDSRQGFFSTSATQVVAEGSYFLTMPTVNGRSALVIFPPDDKSLDDIKYMLGSDDLSEVDVRRMRQARLVDGGKGCLLHSTPL